MNEREEEKDNQPQANAYNALSLIKNATIFFCYIVVYMHVHMYVVYWQSCCCEKWVNKA